MGFVITEVIHTELLVGNVVGEKDGLRVWAACELCLRKRPCTLIGFQADRKLLWAESKSCILLWDAGQWLSFNAIGGRACQPLPTADFFPSIFLIFSSDVLEPLAPPAHSTLPPWPFLFLSRILA